jgi:hypothetical protein
MAASFAFSSIAARQYQPIMAAIPSKDNHNCAKDGNQVTGIQNGTVDYRGEKRSNETD